MTKKPSSQSSPVESNERKALIEIANRAGNFMDADAADWMPSIYSIACQAIGKDPTPMLKANGFDVEIKAWPPSRSSQPVTAMTEKHSPLREALRLLGAEDERQNKLHELLETIREQIRTGVDPEYRPEGLFKNIQDAVYAMRGRTPLLDDAAIVSVFDGLPEAIAALEAARESLAVDAEGCAPGWHGAQLLVEQIDAALTKLKG